MKYLILNITILFYTLSLCAQQNYTKGKIIDSLKVDQNTDETYALYLPKSFSANQLSPIVFIYEPMARGKTGITPFIKASEKYGHILVCSNNSRNGPIERNFAIANRLFDKIFSQFVIDPKRIYTAGFSGGARLASTIAISTKQIAGVIACGAGMSSYLNLSQVTAKFSYAMLIGDEDMNYLELHKTRDYLTKLKVPNELFIYEMNHRWPSQNQILEAFDWLQLEAIRQNTITKNDNLIAYILNKYYEKAKKLNDNNKLLYASEEYLRILRNFKDFYQLDSISKRSTQLLKSKDLKEHKQLLEKSFVEEISLTNMFADRFLKDIDSEKVNMKWWYSEIGKIKKKQEKSILHQSKMYNRLLYKIFAMAFEKVTVGSSSEKINQSIFCYDICISIYPKYDLPYFRQVENYINKKEPEKAIDYLEDLFKTGYSNIDRVKNQKTFHSLKTNERFRKLLKI